jgi:hypothetical protein
LPAQLDTPERLRAAGVDGTGRLSQVSARFHFHEAKTAIIAEMRELDRPATAREIHKKLHKKFGGAWSLKAIEYHLDALRKTGIVEVVFGPELHFQLIGAGAGPEIVAREWCR